MGSNPAPDIANITVFMDEQDCLRSFFHGMPAHLHPIPLYGRLLDDVCMIVDQDDLAKHKSNTYESLLAHISKHPYFTYTNQVSDKECIPRYCHTPRRAAHRWAIRHHRGGNAPSAALHQHGLQTSQ